MSSKNKSLTINIPEGIVPPAIMDKVNELAGCYMLRVYLSTVQNIRLLDIKEEDEGAIRSALLEVGAEFKDPGKFPLPKICVGNSFCNLGVVDTMALSRNIMKKFKHRTQVKPKFKIAIAGCPASCSNALLADIGIKATRAGFDVFVGGKGGPAPKIGRRYIKGASEKTVLEVIETLADFHDRKTGKKQRMYKLLGDPDFPYQEV